MMPPTPQRACRRRCHYAAAFAAPLADDFRYIDAILLMPRQRLRCPCAPEDAIDAAHSPPIISFMPCCCRATTPLHAADTVHFARPAQRPRAADTLRRDVAERGKQRF